MEEKIGHNRFFSSRGICFGFWHILQLWFVSYLIQSHLRDVQATAVEHDSQTPVLWKSKQRKRILEKAVKPYAKISVVDSQFARSQYLQSGHLTGVDRVGIRFFVSDYLKFHKASRYNGTRYLIYSPMGVGGIGDRSNYLIYAYWMGVMSQRIFLVDWQQPYPVSRFLSSISGVNLFFHEHRDTPRNVTARTSHHTSFTRFLNGTDAASMADEQILLSNIRTVVCSRTGFPDSFSKEFLSSHLPKELSPYDALNLRWNHKFRRVVMHHAFRLSNRMRHQHLMEAKRLKIRTPYISPTQGIPLTPYISVHARLGVGVGETAGRFSKIMRNQQKAAKCLAEQAIALSKMSRSPPLPLFLATDTEKFRELFRETVKKMSNNSIAVVAGGWKIIHSRRMHLAPQKDMQNSIWGSYMDLALLGHAQHIVAFDSSFPRLALWLGDAESLTEIRHDVCLRHDSTSFQMLAR